jgi:hypothetical protein
MSTLEEYLDRAMTPPEPAVLRAINSGPIADGGAVLGAHELDRLLDPAPLAAETGWCWTDEHIGYVAVRTEMPGTTGEMWDWWFDWHPRDALRYRIWYPGAHFDVRFKAPREAGAKPFWGAAHFPVEDIGLGSETFRIEFRPPSRYGFSSDVLEDPRVATVVGGFVGSPRRRARVGVIAHVFLRERDGLVLRSRFWLGSALRPDLPGVLGEALGRLISNAPVRRLTMPGTLPLCLARHCAAEYAHLASILPELYERFGPGSPAAESDRPDGGGARKHDEHP